MQKLLIKNGTVVTPTQTLNTSILIENGKIAKIGDITDTETKGAKIIDATNLHVFAGFIDMHVHLREPGQEYKEDLESGARAAIKGGITTIACMPNTGPALDIPALITFIKAREQQVNLCKVHPIGAVTKGQKGNELAELGLMKRAGAVAFSDDGADIDDSFVMRSALEYAKSQDALIILHAEDKALSTGGDINEGYSSTISGLKPIPRAAEEIATARAIQLLEYFGDRLHIAHVSTKGAVELIRNAKKRGLRVTAETCPHYFTLTDEATLTFDTNTKCNPPLRTQSDIDAIITALRDGTIDCIATDHAPHHIDDKQMEYAKAAFGISGLETSFALSYTALVKSGKLSLNQLTKLLTHNAKQILRLDNSGILEVGSVADIVVVDLNNSYKIDKTKFASKGKNTPYHGTDVFGEVKVVIVDGEIK